MRDEKDNIIMGSSKLAGVVSMFDSFRVVGEFLLLRRNLNTPFLYTGGSAYMHPNLESCENALKSISKIISNQGGLPALISPFIIGIAGRGIVSSGAVELLEKNMDV